MRERTYAAHSKWPLAVIGAVFVLPTYRSCGGALHSPAHFASGGLGVAAWVSPVFLCAGVLALLAARALKRGEMDVGTRRLGLLTIGVLGASTLGLTAAMTVHTPSDWPWLAAGLAATAVAVPILRAARGKGPWRIWDHLVAAYAVLAMAAMPSIWMGGDVVDGHFGNLGPGAWLFFGAQLALWVLLVRTRARARPA